MIPVTLTIRVIVAYPESQNSFSCHELSISPKEIATDAPPLPPVLHPPIHPTPLPSAPFFFSLSLPPPPPPSIPKSLFIAKTFCFFCVLSFLARSGQLDAVRSRNVIITAIELAANLPGMRARLCAICGRNKSYIRAEPCGFNQTRRQPRSVGARKTF